MKRVFVKDGVVVAHGIACAPGVDITCSIDGAQAYEVSDSTRAEWGWLCSDEEGVPVFTPPPPTPPTLGPNEFHFLWTVEEQVTIDELRATDKGIDLFMQRLEDPRTVTVVLGSPPVQAAIYHTVDALVVAGTIAPTDKDIRLAAILAGRWPA